MFETYLNPYLSSDYLAYQKEYQSSWGRSNNFTSTLAFHQPEHFNPNSIKHVIFNDPATIVIWEDGTKTVVKCQKDKGDTYNPEHGLAMCIIKKMCGNKSNYYNIFKEWLPKE